MPPGPGGSCAHGWSRSGSFCVTRAGAQDAIPLPPNVTCRATFVPTPCHDVATPAANVSLR
jgi:hypothetical protein